MRRTRSLLVFALAGIALASLAFLQLGAAEQKEPEAISVPLGEKVIVAHTGMGSLLTGHLVAQDRDWLVLKNGDSKFWVSRPQIVYLQHPAPTVAPPPPATR